MLLKESLGRANCLTTVIAQVSDFPVHLPEALSTIYLVSRIRRAQRRPKVRIIHRGFIMSSKVV